MSREVLILRHAHAEPIAAGVGDFERPLSKVGGEEADSIGRWLSDHDVELTQVLSSPATRARQTAERALAIAGGPAIAFEPHIYEATPGVLMELLDRAAGEGRTMLVGHNPGLEQLVALLLEGRSDDYRGLPPGGLAWIKLPDEGELEPGCGTARHFWFP
ncbi:MAG TPA: histidine phosphatase family protein [Candidatus Saccharimonadia bacterium]|nr:histidine phosphatase family protein [Candidatus Saccharimonadia bacterium]